MKRAAVLLGAAAAVVTGGACLYSVIERIPLGDGFYWAIETASTVGYGDVTPHSTAGRVIAVAVMLTAIPLLGAVFAMLTAAHLHKRVHASVSEHLAAAEKRIAEEADARHVIMQGHVERLLKGHCADIKEHVSAVAGPPAGAPAAPPRTRRPARTRGEPGGM